ncbi:AraC-type DNA-binding protein [Salegentibacter agarivorans]|uniref:AraC-type DNA-binding protein n=1 Tax=Salegentibacter agarivorans TaxID=345907 RepID=A0A1I2KM47_9FLAO|nr:AraC family transcriptional regulator [Salegentibacter agarivorans]SFF67593.1 AraC-type DNA-binding protein [Salegentibacter agarivorans]
MKAQFEKVTSSRNSSFNAFIYSDESFNAPYHFHPEYELTYILEGEGTRHVGNSVQQFEAGDFVLLGSNLPHCWKNSPSYNGDAKSLVFQWDDDLLGDGWLEKNEFRGIHKLLEKAAHGLKLKDDFEGNLLEKLSGIVDQPPIKRLLSFLHLLEELSAANNFETLTNINFKPNLNLKANSRVDRIYNFVQQNYQRKITLEEVSEVVSMGNEAFCRFFKRSLNKSFFSFLNEYRINMASKKLIYSNSQVGQIAYDCGYDSLPFFYRQFKKFKNCSPLSFRKSFRKVSAQS